MKDQDTQQATAEHWHSASPSSPVQCEQWCAQMGWHVRSSYRWYSQVVLLQLLSCRDSPCSEICCLKTISRHAQLEYSCLADVRRAWTFTAKSVSDLTKPSKSSHIQSMDSVSVDIRNCNKMVLTHNNLKHSNGMEAIISLSIVLALKTFFFNRKILSPNAAVLMYGTTVTCKTHHAACNARQICKWCTGINSEGIK